MLSTIAEIVRDLLIFVGVVAVLLAALVIIVSKMPHTNPLKRVLTALCYRLGATLAAGASLSRLKQCRESTCSMMLEFHSSSCGTGSRFSEMLVA